MREARHDLRQHLNLIEHYLQSGKTEDLNTYIEQYRMTLPPDTARTWCENYAVNTIISYYGEEARKASVDFSVRIQLPPSLPLGEPQLCSIFGNLLENALDACQTGRSESETAQPFIRVCAVQTGTSTLSITVDNTSVFKPTWIHEKLVSTKTAGSGIGTESIRMIAEQYRGDARFEWRDGVFYASVMLNP